MANYKTGCYKIRLMISWNRRTTIYICGLVYLLPLESEKVIYVNMYQSKDNFAIYQIKIYTAASRSPPCNMQQGFL